MLIVLFFEDFAEMFMIRLALKKVTWDTSNDLVLVNLSSFSFHICFFTGHTSLLQMKKVFSIYFMYSILQYNNASD